MTLDEIAAAIADPAVPRDQLLAALGKGGGKGAAPGARPFRFSPKPGAKTSSQQQHQQQQQQVRPSQTGATTTGARTETRRCYNCGEAGHIGKDCSKPDRRLLKQDGPHARPKGLRALTATGDDGFTAVTGGFRCRLCCLQPRPVLQEFFWGTM